MPRPLRTVKPPSALSATAKPTTTITTTKKSTTKANTTKSRTTRSGTKDVPDIEPEALAPLPTPLSVESSKKPSPAKKVTAAGTKTLLTKRSTRSKASTTTIEEAAPAPKLRATRRKPAAKEPEPVLEQEPEVQVEQTPEELEFFLPSAVLSPPPPSSPETQVPASSNAENHTPSTQFRSSPPPMPSTPSLQATGKRRIVLEFGSDAGYSPPPARPTSAERPRLRELQPVSLEPLDPTESEVDEENVDPRASPTPKRGRKSGFVPVVEGERVGRPSAFYIPGADEEAFTIYSDPKSPTPPTLPRNTAFDDTMRPPESSPATTPVKMRKRRSSGAVVDSDDDLAEQQQGDVDDEVEKTADRKGKRRKAIVEKVRIMTTADLRDLLPRRKKNSKPEEKDEYDVLSTSEDVVESDDDSSDELSRPTAGRTTRSGRAGTKKTTTKTKPAKTTKTAKKTTNTKSRNARATSTVPRLPSSARVSKTYARKSFSSEKENDSPTKLRNRNRRDSAVDVAGPSSSGDETIIADGGKSGRKKLKEVVEKFKEVDRWEMEFEDVSPRSLEVGSEGGR